MDFENPQMRHAMWIDMVERKLRLEHGMPFTPAGRQHAERLMQDEQMTVKDTTVVIAHAQRYAAVLMQD